MSHSFRFLDDIATADLAFDASGDSLQELFHGATCAVIEAMADPSTVGFTWRKSVERREEDPAELLFIEGGIIDTNSLAVNDLSRRENSITSLPRAVAPWRVNEPQFLPSRRHPITHVAYFSRSP